MKRNLKFFFVPLALACLTSTAVFAEDRKKVVIALNSGDFGLVKTDVSDLAIGESKTIETDSGKVIDILRTADGVELYVDGELLDMDIADHELHEQHAMRTHVKIICDDEQQDCDEDVLVLDGHEGFEIDALTDGHGKKVIIHKNIDINCTDDEDGHDCDDKMVWVPDAENFDIDALHEHHGEDGAHRVLIVRKEIDSEN